jgi:ABC-type Zn uptake system ZnuABC Zn-binding protein ZnuA
MNRVPLSERKLVTDHDAFGYFARRYRIRIVGAVIPSQTTEAQPSAGELAKLASVIEREHVPAVFPESSINPKLARAIANETGASSDFTLYGDTLGRTGSEGDTYVRMEASNAETIARGLSGGRVGCSIPAR